MAHVLVIDDERPTLAMFELLLSAMGHTPVSADSGERGLELFAHTAFDIVLTDIKMPGIDGMEVLSRIKTHSPATEVIVITGHGDVDLALTALNLKAADFIDKPISQEALAQALKRASERINRRQNDTPNATLRETEGVRILDIAGNLSTDLGAQAALLAQNWNGQPLLVTVSECASINGAGIEGLARVLRQQAARNAPTAIACKPENFRKVFEAAGLTTLASLHPSEEEALRALLTR